MKKFKSFIRIFPVLLIIMTLTISCKKEFLEVTPKGKLIAQTVTDYDLLLNNNNLLNTGSANAQVFLGDEVAAVEPFFTAAEPKTQRLFKWEDVVYEDDENAGETSSLLQSLYIYNKIINEVMNAEDGTESRKRSIQAEALAGRAWVYFQLINYFGKPYNAATAANDPGFPIVTEADVTVAHFQRSSVQAVYDLIVDDLTTALPNLPSQTTHRYRMSRSAGEALLGKVYMFMGKFEDALPHLNNAFAGLSNTSVPLRLIDYNDAFAPNGEFQPIEIFGPTTPTIANNPETMYAKQFSNFWITSSELVINPQTVALFEPSDLRLNFYSTTPFPFGDPYPAGMLRRMGPLTTSYGVVLPELYLLRAETRARLNDLPGAVADLETLREHRMPAADATIPSAIASDKMALLNFIIDERVREFAAQGVRWYDMRRLSVDPLFGSASFTHQVYDEAGGVTNYTFRPERFTLRIPQKIVNENPGMGNNP